MSSVIVGAVMVVIGSFGVYGSVTGKLGPMLAVFIAPTYVKQTNDTTKPKTVKQTPKSNRPSTPASGPGRLGET